VLFALSAPTTAWNASEVIQLEISSAGDKSGFSRKAKHVPIAIASYRARVVVLLLSVRLNVSAQTTPPKTHANIPLSCLQII